MINVKLPNGRVLPLHDTNLQNISIITVAGRNGKGGSGDGGGVGGGGQGAGAGGKGGDEDDSSDDDDVSRRFQAVHVSHPAEYV